MVLCIVIVGKMTTNLNSDHFLMSAPEAPCRETLVVHGNTSLTSSWFGRTVRKASAYDSFLAKALKIFFIIVLAVSIIGIPVLFFWNKAHKENFKRDSLQRLGIQGDSHSNVPAPAVPNMDGVCPPPNLWVIWNKSNNKKMMAELGFDRGNFARLPVLDLQNRNVSLGPMDFLLPEDLRDPIMKGVDPFDRPFIAMKLMFNRDHRVYVTTLHQNYVDHGDWIYSSNCRFLHTETNAVDSSFFQFFHEVIEGTHGQWSLVV